MKRTFLIPALLLSCVASFAQQANVTRGRYTLGMQYCEEFVLKGFVHVREWDMEGDKMLLKDLGMRHYSAVQLAVKRSMQHDRYIELLYDHYFIRGKSRFERDIFYNGTIIDGRAGLDVSPTRYYRVSARYSGRLLKRDNIRLNYLAGLTLDHIVFYLNGKVSPTSPKNEVYENFGRQAFPYPVVGILGRCDLSAGEIRFEVSGSYIPEFKSFYTEGGSVSLQYSNFLADLYYSRRADCFIFGLGAKFRHMRLFQESKEDTNEIRTLTVGPYAEIRYLF